MVLTSNSTFGIYEVGDIIGEGGMGKVYRATDTSLDRQVAIKVLPESFAGDTDRVNRFDREAKTLASLNHPNIAQIHGLEKIDGTIAIIMELVEGPTLADRISEGPIPAEEALRIAKQIIDGLEAAHDRGIVHRDLKPANIKVKADGSVKILDFGIAKPIERTGISASQHTPTLLTPVMTESGVIMGTAAYMSPEQARGRFVDQRTDIWAFGCVLFEMLTGQPVFAGEDITVTLARVLEREIDLSTIPGMVTPSVRRTLSLCLEKDPAKRIHHIADVRLAMAGVFDTAMGHSAQADISQPLWKKLLPVSVAVVIAAAVSASFTLMLSGDSASVADRARVRRSVQTLPPDQALNFPVIPAIGIAADDSRMVYAAGGALYIRDMDELTPRLIPGTESEVAVVPSFSPDGTWIAYANGPSGDLRKVSVDGGTPLPILPFIPASGFHWVDNNTIIYGNNNEIWQVTADGGSPELLVSDNPGYQLTEPLKIPGTDLVLYERRSPDRSVSEVTVTSLGTGETDRLFSGGQPTYLDAGYLVYFESTLGLMARAFDPQTLEFGSPIVMVNDILRVQKGAGGSQFRVSDNGSLLYVKGEISADGGVMLALADEKSIIQQLDVPLSGYENPSVSPDGKQLAVENQNQIYVYNLDGNSEMRQLTFEGSNSDPSWSPDGQWVTYSSRREGTAIIYRQRADGRGVAEALTEAVEDRPQYYPVWAPDGRLTYQSPNEEGSIDIWIVSIPLGEPEVLVGGEGTQEAVAFSDDGQAMAYASSQSGNYYQVMVAPFPPDGSSTRVSAAGVDSDWPVWSGQGDSLYYQFIGSGGQFASVDISLPDFEISNRRQFPFTGVPTTRRLSAIPNTNQLVFAIPVLNNGESDAPSTEIIFVENWLEELKQRVPKE